MIRYIVLIIGEEGKYRGEDYVSSGKMECSLNPHCLGIGPPYTTLSCFTVSVCHTYF